MTLFFNGVFSFLRFLILFNNMHLNLTMVQIYVYFIKEKFKMIKIIIADANV